MSLLLKQWATGIAGGQSWSSYWATLISATVENAAPTHVVLTFPAEGTSVATDITATVNGEARAVSSASWTGGVWTIVLASAVEYGDVVVMTFVPSGGTAAVTNNVQHYLTLTKKGTGATVGTIILNVTSNTSITLDGDGRFYSDAGGTLGESTTWNVTTGADRTMYYKVTNGSSRMTFADASKVTKLRFSYVAATNAPIQTGDIGKFTNATYLDFETDVNCQVSGDITNVTGLQILVAQGSASISGDISALPLTRLNVTASANTLTGDLSTRTDLTYVNVSGLNTIYGDIGVNNVVSGLTVFYLTGNNRMVNYTGGISWGNINVTINPAIGYGFSSAEIDAILIDMAKAGGPTSKIITLMGNNAGRTAASDAAYATLTTTRGCTVNLNPG